MTKSPSQTSRFTLAKSAQPRFDTSGRRQLPNAEAIQMIRRPGRKQEGKRTTKNDSCDSQRQREKRSWVFQANPRLFNLTEALKHIRIIRWRIKQFKGDIQSGDDVYLWLSGSDGGMVARGTTITDPQFMWEAEEELPFVNGEGREKMLRVAVIIDTVFDQPVQRPTLKRHSGLSSMSIVQMPRQTNYSLTTSQAESLNALCPRHGLPLDAELDERRGKMLRDLDDLIES